VFDVDLMCLEGIVVPGVYIRFGKKAHHWPGGSRKAIVCIDENDCVMR